MQPSWKQSPSLKNLLTEAAMPLIHRDLSWLQFNDRVLREAQDKKNPILKRFKFLAISQSNLDEFFQIRFASVLRAAQLARDTEKRTETATVRDEILKQALKFLRKQERCFSDLRKTFAAHGLHIHIRQNKNDPHYQLAKTVFEQKILPQLVSHSEPFAQASTKIPNLASLAYFHETLWFRIPRQLPQVHVELLDKDQVHFFLTDDLIARFLGQVFRFRRSPVILRFTRDADFSVDFNEDDTDSVPDLIRKNIGFREIGRCTRIQALGEIPQKLYELLLKTHKILPTQILQHHQSLFFGGFLGPINNLPSAIAHKEGFNNPPLTPALLAIFRSTDPQSLFAAIKKMDMVFHYPYDSFDSYILWLEAAAKDPDVVSIEQTIYRIDSLSRIVAALKLAAKTKKVRVVLELRARFDELNNLQLAEELRGAGVEVGFGFGDLKLHAKITLVTRKEADQLIRYTHLSTGNYNAKTARLYTDLAILTANSEIGDDARDFFDAVAREEVPTNFKQLVVAPTKLHNKLRSLIRGEIMAAKAGKPAYIFTKVNSLVDPKIIEELYLASKSGVKIDLVVRSSCSLVPGIKGISENIRVISIVDRYLEHSRIYYFASSNAIYFCSADWMPRNFFSRLEIAYPILDPEIARYFTEVILPGYMKDTAKARELNHHGIWARRKGPHPAHRAQSYFENLAKNHYKDTPLFQHGKKTNS